MTEGIIARFRTMAIARVVGAHRARAGQPGPDDARGRGRARGRAAARLPPDRERASTGSPAAGVLALITFALTWLSVALGLVSKSVETASNLPMFLLLLPFLGSGFVPTDSMPAGLRWFAEHQPFTPIIETLRGLLMGTPIGTGGIARGRLVRGHRAGRLPLGEAAAGPPAGALSRLRGTRGGGCGPARRPGPGYGRRARPGPGPPAPPGPAPRP